MGVQTVMKVQTRMGCKQLTRRIKQLTRRMLNDKQLNFLVMVNMLVITVAATLTQGAFVDLYNLQTMAGQVLNWACWRWGACWP